MKFLIVEDSQPMRNLIKKMVGDLAEAIYECSDGVEALLAYTQFRPDWVLMDIEMKEMDGITATKQILAAWPQARVCILTHYDDAKLREAARRAGACEYV